MGGHVTRVRLGKAGAQVLRVRRGLQQVAGLKKRAVDLGGNQERGALLQSARDLDEQMRTIRNSGSVIGLERIAVMAALNLTYELSKVQQQSVEQSASNEDLSRLDQKISAALQSLEQTSAF